MKFELIDQPMVGLKLLKRTQVSDERGGFSRLFCADQLAAFGWSNPIAQSNISVTKIPGTMRGLHYQNPPHAEDKLVTCVTGAVFDVAVDLRTGSSTFGKWFGTELSNDNQLSLLIPKGFAHGFQAIKPNTAMIYFHSEAYAPTAENGIRWDDRHLAIDWPLPVKNMSERDIALPPFAALAGGISI
ncbi:dTDP-4-dehydrorhamnose 3,5-epimerase [Maritalea sp.]|uniref:dTDP-4-dehydrorhamnose 3,5-epimerase n=1 Tax=Maritalea sp. TaxID=2003361 RepID=UPI003EF93493